MEKPNYTIDKIGEETNTENEMQGNEKSVEGGIKKSSSLEEIDRLEKKQREEIKKEIEKEPMISKKIQIFSLLEDFKENDLFENKTMDLVQNKMKEYMRKIRKDGSCFYRSFLFRLCELCLIDGENLKRFKIFEKIEEGSTLLLKAGFDLIVFEDFQDFFKELFLDIKNKKMDESQLYKHLNEKMNFDYYIMYLRFLISAFIRVNKDLFSVYFESEKEMINFCQREVEPIDSQTDHMQIIALYNFLNIPLRIFYIDNSQSNETTCISFPEIEKNDNENILKTSKDYPIQLLYRPGHYDLLY
jgi:hypothetical protein